MTGTVGTKRKSGTPDSDEGTKRRKLACVAGETRNPAVPSPAVTSAEQSLQGKDAEERFHTGLEEVVAHSSLKSAPKERVVKLAPPRPFPTVPTSVSATGPRSAHVAGKNHICVTRKTPLGAYLRRCKDVILKDGYKTLHLSAMGAAIPHAVQLSVSLPAILPHAAEEIHTEVLTGSVDVKDEIIPDDEEEDITYRARGKSTISINITIGDGVDEIRRSRTKKASVSSTAVGGKQQSNRKQKAGKPGGHVQEPERIIVRVDEMDDQ